MKKISDVRSISVPAIAPWLEKASALEKADLALLTGLLPGECGDGDEKKCREMVASLGAMHGVSQQQPTG